MGLMMATLPRKALLVLTLTTATFFGKFSAILKNGEKSYLIADKPCSADIHLCEMIYEHYMMAPEIFEGDNKRLLEYARKFFSNDKLKPLEDLKLPCNNKMAKWG